ncbi:DUF4961 domain-containing protein [Mucilaginibacter sp.]|uniref:DUF4961 domain-containing protein n=1 Tax=Mucilaginibacter sp. TaxID=1882438 RepID=UPI00284356A2|nr:DUF4961 domain-containing protein [Mucilaginibacter sp.]MDR3693402.1 DUF4961 domain-containing protein [Mucilaginibacter sp.]
MKVRLHIKGKNLWRLCTLIVLCIVLSCCYTIIDSVDQPGSAVVGSTVKITVNVKNSCNSSGTARIIFGFLTPKGWKTGDNAKVTYSSSKGDGNMVLLPANSTIIAAHSNGVNWPTYMKNFFGNAGNLIDDVEWVAYQSDVPVNYNNGDKITGTINITINNIGADGNPTLVKLAYVVANDQNGFTFDGNDGDSSPTTEYYNEFVNPSCFELTGGTGDLVDFCNPQLTTIDPPKSLDNDIVTLTYNNNVVTPALLANSSAVYLCATATMSDGKTVTVCDQSAQTMLTQTSATSGIYRLTFWPRKLFGATTGQTVISMTYFITDKSGSTKIGYGGTSAPFTYKFKCT